MFHLKAFLDATITDPPTWLLVAGHYPLYSQGGHGDTEDLVEYHDVFASYGVHAYICGHDHISEHLQQGPVEYFVVGAGEYETDCL